MRNALSTTELELLCELAGSDVLLAFDYDGTLAPIVEDPAKAYMTSETRDLLWQVTQRYPVIVITGRAQADALRRVRGVGVLEVVGNHGIEVRNASTRYSSAVRRWRPRLEAAIAGWAGVALEDKTYSIAVHYRAAPDRAVARAAILRLAEELDDARVMGGKEVVNLVPRGAVDKGSALLREQERLGCTSALYVGDDETDEDVFVRARLNRILGIRVGESAQSAATHFIADQMAIHELLRALIALRDDQGDRRSRRGRVADPSA